MKNLKVLNLGECWNKVLANIYFFGQLCTKYIWKSKNIVQNQTRPKNFDTYFCVVFEYQFQIDIFGDFCQDFQIF